jgi:hypothetical protein
MVIGMATLEDPRGTAPPPAADVAPPPAPRPTTPGGELRFLHGILRLATTARTWEELLETVVDGTRDALGADVSSLYLLDRDGANLTLAATNGLDRHQIGRARVPFGEGITGACRESRAPEVDPRRPQSTPASSGCAASTSAGSSRRCSRCRSGGTTRSSASSTSRRSSRATSRRGRRPAGAIADLLAGIVEKGRQQREAEAQVEALKAIDQARTELIALVTHELRTPLAVVRAYTDLLAEEPPLEGRSSRATRAAGSPGPPGMTRPSSRSSGSTASWTRSSRPSASCRTSRRPGAGRRRRPRRRGARRAPAAAPPSPRGARAEPAARRPRRPRATAPDPRAPARERREVRAARHDDHDRLVAVEGSSGSAWATRARGSRRSGGSASSSRTQRRETPRRAAPGSGCTPRAPRRVDGRASLV